MKVGILGMGRAGHRHWDNAQRLGHEVLSYDPLADADARNRNRVLKWADVVVIASPSECHLQDLADCIKLRKPALVEKPIALTGQGEKLIALLDKAKGLPIAVGYNLRFHPQIRTIKTDIKNCRPYYAGIWCCQYTESKGPAINGCLNEWACHEIDLALHLLGDLRVIDKYVDRFRVDLGLIGWETKSHVHIHSDMSYRGNLRGGIIVAKDRGFIYDLETEPVEDDHYKAELASFFRYADGSPDGILATAADGLAVLQVCEKADTTRYMSK